MARHSNLEWVARYVGSNIALGGALVLENNLPRFKSHFVFLPPSPTFLGTEPLEKSSKVGFTLGTMQTVNKDCKVDG